MHAVFPSADGFRPRRVGDTTVRIVLDGADSGLYVSDARGHFLDPVPPAVSCSKEYRHLHTLWRKLHARHQRWCQRFDRLLGEGRIFTPAQIENSHHHPILADLIHQLVWRDALGNEGLLRGELLDSPRGSTRHSGPLQLAHPARWLEAGTLVKWQHYATAHNLRQPVAQIFRTIYLPEAPAGRNSPPPPGHARTLPVTHVVTTLCRLRWQGPQTGQGTTIFTRHFPEGRAAHLIFDRPPDRFSTAPALAVPTITFSQDGQTTPQHLVPPTIYSEGMLDLERLITES